LVLAPLGAIVGWDEPGLLKHTRRYFDPPACSITRQAVGPGSGFSTHCGAGKYH
jgi:hypothetical protein